MKEKKTEKMLNYANGPSLEEINNTVEVPKNASFWRTLLAYSGPGALVAVGYMDPGNWITSIAGGAEYKYTLLSCHVTTKYGCTLRNRDRNGFSSSD